jgi:hypothetical protein
MIASSYVLILALITVAINLIKQDVAKLNDYA